MSLQWSLISCYHVSCDKQKAYWYGRAGGGSYRGALTDSKNMALVQVLPRPTASVRIPLFSRWFHVISQIVWITTGCQKCKVTLHHILVIFRVLGLIILSS